MRMNLSLQRAGRAFAASILAALTVATAPIAVAQTTGSIAKGESGLPLPRFVSLKSGRVNLRVGPGKDYAVDWMYLKPGLPMEIIQEFDTWRKVRDADGTEGWISQSLLSGKRTAIVAPWHRGKSTMVSLRSGPDDAAPTVAVLEPGASGLIEKCDGSWCHLNFSGHDGYVEQTLIWGAYPGEVVED